MILSQSWQIISPYEFSCLSFIYSLIDVHVFSSSLFLRIELNHKTLLLHEGTKKITSLILYVCFLRRGEKKIKPQVSKIMSTQKSLATISLTGSQNLCERECCYYWNFCCNFFFEGGQPCCTAGGFVCLFLLSKWFTTVAAPGHTLTYSVQGFPFFCILTNSYYLLTFFFFWLCCLTYGILVPQPDIEPGPSAVGVLTTGP